MNIIEFKNIIFSTIYDCLEAHLDSCFSVGENGNVYINEENPELIPKQRYQVVYGIDYDIPGSKRDIQKSNIISISITVSDFGVTEIEDVTQDMSDRSGEIVDVLSSYLRLPQYWELSCRNLYPIKYINNDKNQGVERAKYHINNSNLFVSSNQVSIPKSYLIRITLQYQSIYT
jgi:hypothetical protein